MLSKYQKRWWLHDLGPNLAYAASTGDRRLIHMRRLLADQWAGAEDWVIMLEPEDAAMIIHELRKVPNYHTRWRGL